MVIRRARVFRSRISRVIRVSVTGGDTTFKVTSLALTQPVIDFDAMWCPNRRSLPLLVQL